MKARELGVMWLRGKADELKLAANRIHRFGPASGVLGEVAGEVAHAYSTAAVELERRANEMERRP